MVQKFSLYCLLHTTFSVIHMNNLLVTSEYGHLINYTHCYGVKRIGRRKLFVNLLLQCVRQVFQHLKPWFKLIISLFVKCFTTAKRIIQNVVSRRRGGCEGRRLRTGGQGGLKGSVCLELRIIFLNIG